MRDCAQQAPGAIVDRTGSRRIDLTPAPAPRARARPARLRARRTARVCAFEIVGAILGRLGEFGAERQVADRDLRPARRVAFVRALDDGDPAAPVGVFELAFMPPGAEIEFRGDPCRAQLGDQALVVAIRLVAVEREHDHRARLRRCDDRAVDRPQRRQQARDPSRSRSRNRLGAKARHQSVVAPAAADRAEADRPAVLARRLEGELGLEDRAGVISRPRTTEGSMRMRSAVIAGRASERWQSRQALQPGRWTRRVAEPATIALQRMRLAASSSRPAPSALDIQSRPSNEHRFHIVSASSPAPLVKSPLSSLRPSPSSARTPSGPSRSSLSIALSTVAAARRSPRRRGRSPPSPHRAPCGC